MTSTEPKLPDTQEEVPQIVNLDEQESSEDFYEETAENTVTAENAPMDPELPETHGGLTGGQVMGVIAGAIAAAAVVAAAIYFFLRRKRKDLGFEYEDGDDF